METAFPQFLSVKWQSKQKIQPNWFDKMWNRKWISKQKLTEIGQNWPETKGIINQIATNCFANKLKAGKTLKSKLHLKKIWMKRALKINANIEMTEKYYSKIISINLFLFYPSFFVFQFHSVLSFWRWRWKWWRSFCVKKKFDHKYTDIFTFTFFSHNLPAKWLI